jgi:hypothetical protein
MNFNHVANRLAAAHFETVVALFTQPGTNVDLQFGRSDTTHRDADKQRSQVSFLSLTPREELETLATWLAEQGLAATVGAYSDREFYLDAPDAFVDFVIEAMRPELADYDVKV